jgi:glycosyltransferase involved in cell wall biosynthesis
MKLLILTQYFPPETGAPQNRLFELAVRLQKLGVKVTVLTAMPNYPNMEIMKGYEGKKYHYEEMNGIPVHRASIYVTKKRGIVDRLRNYFSFVISSRRVGTKIEGDFDLLMCESPPLFLGYSALYLAKKKKAKLIFNVSDLWPESAEKLGVVTNSTMLNMAYRLEEKCYRNSALVTGQTQGICKSINDRFPQVKTFWLPNGADLAYYDPSKVQGGNWREKNGFSPEDQIFLYAGIIGIAQGLEVILYAAEALLAEPKCKFVLLGSGPEKERLMAIAKEAKLSNVTFLDAVKKDAMPSIIASVNATIVPLKKLDLFKGAIPSKIFESLAMKVPILLGVEGEAKDLFIEKGNCGIFFEPGNSDSLKNAIQILLSNKEKSKELGENGRKYVDEHFNRDIIAQKFFDILKTLS